MQQKLVPCERCKVEFLAKVKELHRGKGHFCGITCVNAQRSANRKDPDARKKWLAENKNTPHFVLQRKAHHAVEYVVKRGILKKGVCEICGANQRIHAHHGDYTKPLDVQWLCVAHHRELHG